MCVFSVEPFSICEAMKGSSILLLNRRFFFCVLGGTVCDGEFCGEIKVAILGVSLCIGVAIGSWVPEN